MGKMKRLAIQPHSDDILFSCSHILFDPDYEVQVLTVENDKRRIEEDKKLYEFLGIDFHHLNIDFKDESYYGFHKKYKTIDEQNTYEYLNEYFGKNVLNEIEESLSSWITNFLKNNKDFIVIAPWGIGHPFHFFIRDVIQKTVSYMEYYREFPHSYKRRSQLQVEKQKQQYSLLRSVDVKAFDDVKWKLASKFYRSQSGLLFFEQGYIKKQLSEEIYIRNIDKLPF